MNPLPRSLSGAAPVLRTLLPSLLLSALLAGCATTPDRDASPAPAQADCGPCCHRDPSSEASATQGISPAYPNNPYVGKDIYANVVVKEGTVLYSLAPGATPRFAVAEQTLRDAGGSWQKYYALVQVTTDPGVDADGRPRKLRETVRAFHVTEHLCAAHGIARANPQYGDGGGTQYYISPSDSAKLRPGEHLPISRWTVTESAAK